MPPHHAVAPLSGTLPLIELSRFLLCFNSFTAGTLDSFPSMSATSHPSQASPFTFLFIQLTHRLRQTTRYLHIAHQCRQTRRQTHHAKRHDAWINTSKAHVARVDNITLPQTAGPDVSTRSGFLAFVSDDAGAMNEPEGNRTRVEDESENGSMSELGLNLINLPEVVVQEEHIQDQEAYSPPLFQGPVPGAPQWKSKLLPQDDVAMSEPVWQGAMATHAPDLDSVGAVMVCGPHSATGTALEALQVNEIAGGMVSRPPEKTWSEWRRHGL
ncbi:hypothetical protein JVU11DRAFT_9521 [Chiua virens]|nr:hypothetical protein JVU11DRAFT_9521 [Chiua virens]